MNAISAGASRFFLMNKDEEALSFIDTGGNTFSPDRFKVSGTFDEKRLPRDFSNVESWLRRRFGAQGRTHMDRLMWQCECNSTSDFVRKTCALSLNDTFWVKPADSSLSWSDVSLYRNDFDESVANAALFGRGVRATKPPILSPEFTTDGSYAKCWMRRRGRIYLLKSADRGSFKPLGFESHSEAMASQLAAAFLDEHVEYRIVLSSKHRDDPRRSFSACKAFTSENIGFLQYGRMRGCGYDASHPGAMLDFYAGIGSEAAFKKMLVFDALCLNTDRHLGNHGVLFDTDTLEVLGMAPVFDNNKAFLPSYDGEDFGHAMKCASLLSPRIGDDFNGVAHFVLTDGLRRDLRNLRGFEFDRSLLPGLPEGRVRLMERLVECQIEAILKGDPVGSGYVG